MIFLRVYLVSLVFDGVVSNLLPAEILLLDDACNAGSALVLGLLCMAMFV